MLSSVSKTTAIFINQLREKVGVMSTARPEVTTGGKRAEVLRLDPAPTSAGSRRLKDGTDAIGSRTRVKVVKNKMAAPFKQAEFDMIYGTGISREGGLIDMSVSNWAIVRKAGAWYTYEGDQLRSG